jgi:hypothetical protein
MSISSEINRIKTNIANAYAKAEEKGATIPELKNSANLASCVETITSGGGTGSSAGLCPNQIVDGKVIPVSGDMSSLFNGVTTIGGYGLTSAFNQNTGITSISAPQLTRIEDYGMYETFYYCTGLTSINFSALQRVNSYGLYETFRNCSKLASINFNSLQQVSTDGMYRTFYGCKALTTVSFPALTFAQGLDGTFYSCTNIKEIHFRADAQADIESLSGYNSKFGASNATIYFDL